MFFPYISIFFIAKNFYSFLLIISSITDNSINLSKGTLMNWARRRTTEKLEPEIKNIEKELLNAYYANIDESQIKVNGETI